MDAAKSTTFGGTVVGSSILASENNAVALLQAPTTPSAAKGRKTVAPTSTKQRSDTVVKHKVTAEDIKLSSDAIGAALTIKHGFGAQATVSDCICSHGIHAAGGDKENADRVLFRIGKQLCLFSTDSNSQQYLDGRNRKVKNVLHFTISQNNKYVAVCESLKLERDDEMPAQISVYNLTTLARYKTLSHTCEADFVQSTFCGDMKYLASLTGDAERQVTTANAMSTLSLRC
jgi:hypothetical protein